MAARAGVASIDHAYQLSAETMKLMRERGIFAVPTFAVLEYFTAHAATPEAARATAPSARITPSSSRSSSPPACRSRSAPMSGPFPHGTQAREFELLVAHGMTPLGAIRAGTVNGAKLLGWEQEIGRLAAGYYADIVAVPGDPLQDIGVLKDVELRHERRGRVQIGRQPLTWSEALNGAASANTGSAKSHDRTAEMREVRDAGLRARHTEEQLDQHVQHDGDRAGIGIGRYSGTMRACG